MDDNITETPTPDDNYIETIRELKANSVPRADYDKLLADNKQLLQSLVNGESIEQPAALPDITALRKDLFGGERDLSNVEYAAKTLELRDALIAAGERDPFLPWGKNIAPSDDDVKAAGRVADVLRECCDMAQGDNDIFTTELQRRMIDSNPPRGRR